MHTHFLPRSVAIFLAAATLLALIITSLAIYTALMPRYEVVQTELTTPADDLVWSLDRAVRKNHKVVLDGWAVKRHEPIKALNTAFLLSTPDGSFYRLPTQSRLRKDVTEHLAQDNTNYDHSGLHAYTQQPFLPKGPYTVYILYEGNGRKVLINTGTLL